MESLPPIELVELPKADIIVREPTLEDVPQTFTTPEALEEFVNNMLFFDSCLHMNEQSKKLQADTPGSVLLQFNQEFWVVSRLETVQQWINAPEVNKDWLYRHVIKKTPTYKDRVEEVFKISRLSPTFPISHMTPVEWELYKTVFNTLFELHTEKLGKAEQSVYPPITP